jgi:peptidoglycan/LPS O-acetylase OafA/YrhL
MQEPRRRHEPLIDWLRALASISVVLFHLNTVRPIRDGYDVVMSCGWLGVPVFFVVSGYCVMLSSLDRPSPLGFLLKRYVRVFPPYWASLALLAAVVIGRKLTFGTNDVTVLPHSAMAILATFTLMTKPVTSVPVTNWVYWTLSYELAFYGLMALALIRRRAFDPIMLAVTAVGLLLLFYPLTHVPGLFFLDQWPLFALGVGLAELIHRRTAFGIAIVLLSALAVVLELSASVVLAGGLTGASIFAIRYFPQIEAKLKWPIFAFLGRISYSLYLIHVPIGVYVFARIFSVDDGDPLIHKVACDLATLFCVIAVAALFNLVAERPAQQFARDFGKRRSVADNFAEV